MNYLAEKRRGWGEGLWFMCVRAITIDGMEFSGAKVEEMGDGTC